MKTQLIKWLTKIYPIAKRALKKFHGGVFPSYYKELSSRHTTLQTSLPKELILPLNQHIGAEDLPLVAMGDKVKKYQLIAAADLKNLHAPIHAPASGTITAIEYRQLPHTSGLTGLCIVITTDEQQVEQTNPLNFPAKKGDACQPNTPQALKDIVYQAGIVGMGGAGFPTFAKIPNVKGKIQTLIINGAECEPFITCDDVLMQQHASEVLSGAQIIAKALACPSIIAGIEDNKPLAIKAMKQAAHKFENIQIQPLLTIYPMGGEKQLIKELLNTEIPAGTHAIDSGILMMNVSTLRAIHQAINLGRPLISRLITVSGLGLDKPFNSEVLLGTPFEQLVEQAQPKSALNYPLIQGGPMMGFEVPNNQVPVIKTTNCILANPPQTTETTMPCIRCGECMDACPINLLPQQLYWYSRSHEFEKVEKLNLFDCIECGCCSFVCPSHIPLVQYYRFAKSEIKTAKIEQQKANLAQKRHENKLAREARLKAEKDARIKAKKEAIKQKALLKAANTDEDASAPTKIKKSPAVAAAEKAAAMRKKKLTQTSQYPIDTQTQTQTEEMSKKPALSAREKAIAAAKKRSTQTKSNVENSAEKRKRKAQTASNSPSVIETDEQKAIRRAAELAKNMKKKALAEKNRVEKQTNNAPEDHQLTTSQNTGTGTQDKSVIEKPIANKRAVAMQAAKERAAAMKAKKLAEALQTKNEKIE